MKNRIIVNIYILLTTKTTSFNLKICIPNKHEKNNYYIIWWRFKNHNSYSLCNRSASSVLFAKTSYRLIFIPHFFYVYRTIVPADHALANKKEWIQNPSVILYCYYLIFIGALKLAGN